MSPEIVSARLGEARRAYMPCPREHHLMFASKVLGRAVGGGDGHNWEDAKAGMNAW